MKRPIAYFPAAGTTARAAKALAEASEANVFEIEPVIPYTDADLSRAERNSSAVLIRPR